MNIPSRLFIVVAKVLVENDDEFSEEYRYYTESSLEKAFKKRRELESYGAIRKGSAIRVVNTESGCYNESMAILRTDDVSDDWNSYLELTNSSDTLPVEDLEDEDFCTLQSTD